MGTHGQIIFKNKNEQTIGALYSQFDSYPDGLGREIVSIINNGNFKIVNGFSNEQIPQSFNEIGCLAAYLIGKIKGSQIGSYYLSIPGENCSNLDYTYILHENNGSLHVRVLEFGKVIFEGSFKDFVEFVGEEQ
jgi:hypothetical protein